MIEELADLLAQTLTGVTGISKLGGIVQTLETTKPLTANPWMGAASPERTLRLPIARTLTPNPLARTTAGAAVDYVPNSSESAIVYIEEQGAARQIDQKGQKFSVTLRVVGWYNTGATATNILPARVLRALDGITASGSFAHVNITGRSVLPGSAALFSRYTYSQLNSQYLFPPYTAFAIDVQLQFVLNPHCV